MNSKYDIVIHRDNGESVGYMCAWGESSGSPFSVSTEPPEMQMSTGAGKTESGGSFTARDAAPPYPIVSDDWRGGAGQPSYDTIEAVENAFLRSRQMEVTQAGHFELGPLVLNIPDTGILNVVSFAMGTFWAGFTPAGGDPRNQLRYLARVSMTATATAGYFLATTGSTDFMTANLDLIDLSLGTSVITAAVIGDYFYSPSTGEIVRIASGTTPTWVVTRGECGTTTTTHVAGEKWVLLRWVPVTFASTDPAQPVTAISSDGEYVYAAFHTPGSDNGSVWKGKPTSADWTSFSTDNNIVDLTFCSGYLYGVQAKFATSTRSVAGWFTTAGVFTPVSLADALTPQTTHAGVTSVGNFVYWGTTDGFSSTVYRIQHSTEDTFELVAQLPPGFTMSDLRGHLGNLYAAGYVDTLATTTHDANLPQYEGALYIVGNDNTMARLFRIKDASDSRIKGLSSVGPYLLCLTNEDVYLYDATTGGYSHYADPPTNSISGVTEDIDWTTAGFYWDFPSAGTWDQNFMTARSAWDVDTDGDIDVGFIAETQATGSGISKTYNTDYQEWRCDARKWYRVTISDLPTTQGTLEWKVDRLRSQGATIVVGMDSKEVRVKMAGLLSGGTAISYRFFLGYTSDPDCDIPDYNYYTAATVPVEEHTLRLTFGSFGAKLYVDGTEGASVSFSQLRNAQDDNSISFAVGYPGDPGDNDDYERVRWTDLRFTADAAYPPEYTGGTLITTGMSGIASAQGATVIPVPATCWSYIDPQRIIDVGWLEASDSAFHMGSAPKYFVKLVADHSAIQSGQTLELIPIVDDTPVGGASGIAGSTVTSARIGAIGTEIRWKAIITDDDPARAYEDRLRCKRVTARFFPGNSPHVHAVYLNCREGIQCRNEKDWDFDPEEAIRHIFSAADSGEVVRVDSIFTGEGQEFRIEGAKLLVGPADREGYDKLLGTVSVRMRRVDE